MKLFSCILIGCIISMATVAQDSSRLISLPQKEYRRRVKILVASNLALSAGSMEALYNTWYKDYPSSSFHFFNDNAEWLNMDKYGHMWTAYQISRLAASSWKWTGLSHKHSTWIGGISGVAYQTIIETFDGFSSAWGWSWGDFTANVLGSGLYVSQELGWQQQKVQIKFSFHRNDYSNYGLNNRADSLFGHSFLTRMLKDYNAQTYWLSGNLQSLIPSLSLPLWLNIAIGQGAAGMFGGSENLTKDAAGNITFNRTDIPRYRRWYLAPDIDLTRIPTKSKVLKKLFFALNTFKFPTPALELSQGKLQWQWIVF